MEFNIWDLWDYNKITVKKVDGSEITARVLCVDEYNDDGIDDGVIFIDVENKAGICRIRENDIEYITSEKFGSEIIKRGDNSKWQKTALTI